MHVFDRTPLRKRQAAALLLVLALLLWGGALFRQSQRAQTQRHIDAGIAFAREGQAGSAEREWREAARLSPKTPLVWELLGELYMNTDQWGKGMEAYRNLIRLAPDKPALYARLAVCALRSGEEVLASQYAREELKRHPDDPPSLTILAFLSEIQDDPEMQIDYLQRLLRRSPDDIDSLRSLAQAYGKLGKYADSGPVLERLLALKPDDAAAHALRAIALYQTDASPAALSRAEADLLDALRQNALYPFARYYLGRIYLRQGRFKEAAFQLELAQRLTPHEMNVPFELATVYARLGQPERAAAARRRFETLRQEVTQISVLQKRCSLAKDDFDSHLTLGKLTLARGDYRQAGYYLGRAVALRPDSAEAKQAYDQLRAELRGRAAAADAPDPTTSGAAPGNL
jgi:Flp pilus assembly protein TadD